MFVSGFDGRSAESWYTGLDSVFLSDCNLASQFGLNFSCHNPAFASYVRCHSRQSSLYSFLSCLFWSEIILEHLKGFVNDCSHAYQSSCLKLAGALEVAQLRGVKDRNKRRFCWQIHIWFAYSV